MTQIETIIAEIERRYNQNNDKLTKIPEYCDEASILRMVCAEDLYFRDFINSLPAEQPSDGLEKASYHAAMELMNNPNFTPKTILGQFISMLQGLFKDGAQWPARAPHLLPV